MPIPTFDQMLHPLLRFAVQQEITRRSATELIADHFKLSLEERVLKLPSGKATSVRNRAGWAMTFLTKGALIERVAKHTYRGTPSGAEFLEKHPNGFGVRELRRIESWKAAWVSSKANKPAVEEEAEDDVVTATPVDRIDAADNALRSELRERLIKEILAQSPAFFESLVLDVLLAMGYGGSRENAAERLGRSGDEGIDGRINQDALGLDQIMVQAKRYAPGNKVDRKSIQAFIGSLSGQGVTKGIFITTSEFVESVEEFITRGSNTKIVLIDGEDLVDLMLRHHIGVRVERTVEILTLDQNYFEDDE